MEVQPQAVRRFKAKINIIYSMHTSIRVGYTPYLHILMVRQSAVVENCEPVSASSSPAAKISPEAAAAEAAAAGDEVSSDREAATKGVPPTLRPGDMSMITFRFAYRPEFVRPGMRIMFRDGKVKGIGVITECMPIGEDIGGAEAEAEV